MGGRVSSLQKLVQKPKNILFLLHKEFDIKKHRDKNRAKKGSLIRETKGERNEKTRGNKKKENRWNEDEQKEEIKR